MRAALASAVFASIVAAQGPALTGERPPWRWHAVDAADATVLALCWSHGLDDDAVAECGAAAAVAEYRLLRARRAAPAGIASGVRVLGDASIVWVLVPAPRTADGLSFCRALLDDAAPLDDDLAAVAIARAALAADDADWLHPGTALVGRARRALLLGAAAHGVAGTATAIQTLTPARLAELLATPVRVRGLGLGRLPADLMQVAEGLPMPGGVPVVVAPPPGRLAEPPPHGLDTASHPRADGPIAALVFPTAMAEPLALAMAIEVAKMRAAHDLPLRGPEARARAPLVAWSWLDGDPVVLFCRRGVDGHDPTRAFAELDALVADLRTRPPTVAEHDTALRTLRWEFGLLPLPPGTDGAALPGRAVALLLAERRGIRDADLARVTPATAHAALGRVCEPLRGWRGVLVPIGSR